MQHLALRFRAVWWQLALAIGLSVLGVGDGAQAEQPLSGHRRDGRRQGQRRSRHRKDPQRRHYTWQDRAGGTEQASQRAGIGSDSDHGGCCLGDRRGRSIRIVSQHDDADIDDLALGGTGSHRFGNNHGRTITDRTCLILPGPTVDELVEGALAIAALALVSAIVTVGAFGDRWAGGPLVRAAVVACGSLPAGFRRGSRVHR